MKCKRFFYARMDHLNDEKVLLGLSAGINSMAILCHMKEQGIQPKELHLFYAHFNEHSPDSFKFVKDGVRFAREHFRNVFFRMERNSVLQYFEKQNMIPHPANSPCSKWLKIERFSLYAFEHGIMIDLVGYVKHELKRREERQAKNKEKNIFALDKQYPIGAFSDEWCFDIVDRNIGWHPAIYDLRWDDPGFVKWVAENEHHWSEQIKADVSKRIGKNKRVFAHNNCLPCKNMHPYEIIAVQYFFFSFYKDAMTLSEKLQKYWGRDKAEFYATFGRDLGQESTCTSCVW